MDERSDVAVAGAGAEGKVGVGGVVGGGKKWGAGDVAGVTIGQGLDGFHLPEDARRMALFLVRTTTYVNDEHHVSADVPVGQIQMALANGVHYLDGGWASLVDGLAAAARRNGAEIRTGAAVTSVSGAGPVTGVAGAPQLEARGG